MQTGLSYSTSLGKGLTSSHPYLAPVLPAVEELRDEGLMPALGSHLPGPPPAYSTDLLPRPLHLLTAWKKGPKVFVIVPFPHRFEPISSSTLKT